MINKLLERLIDYSDDDEIMFEFIEAIKFWQCLIKGDIKICLVDLSGTFGEGTLYIAFDDRSGAMTEPAIYTTDKFIEYYKEVLQEATDLEPEKYWIETLQDIIGD